MLSFFPIKHIGFNQCIGDFLSCSRKGKRIRLTPQLWKVHP